MSTTQTLNQLDRVRDWIEGHDLPDAAIHMHANPVKGRVSIFASTPEAMRAARRAVGPMTKRESSAGGGFVLDAEHDGIEFTIFPPDGACERVKVGERVEEVVKEVRPAETVTVEEIVDVYEWDCGGVLVEDDDTEQVPA